MQGKIAVVLIIAAFCAGALFGRIYSVSTASVPQITELAVPMPNQADSGWVSVENRAFTMQNCLAGAEQRGMTATQARYACDQIMD